MCRSTIDGSASAGGVTAGGAPSVRGSVIAPVSAVAAAVDGEHKYTRSSAVPLRPGKLRLNVRTDASPLIGACPMPIQGPQTGSSMRAPAVTS
jgi:hypothetical protein